jgi:hypothetical protein
MVSFLFYEIGSLVEYFFKGLIKLLQYQNFILIDSIQEVSYVNTFSDHVLSEGFFTYSRVVWDLGIIFNFIRVQQMEHQVVVEFLEDKKYLGREECNVPIFGFPYFVVGGNLLGLC